MSQPQESNPYQAPATAEGVTRQQIVVPYEPHSRVPWNGWDVLFVFGQVVLWEIVGQSILRHLSPALADDQEPNVRHMQWQLVTNSAASCAALVTGILTLKLQLRERIQVNLQKLVHFIQRQFAQNFAQNEIDDSNSHETQSRYDTIRGASWQDMGFSVQRPIYDLLLGLKSFVIIAVPVFGLQFLLVQWFPSEHPLVKMVRDEPGSQTLIIAAIAAIVVAPLVEEFLFRVVLQGWLQSRESRWSRAGYPLFRGLPRGGGPILLSSTLFAALHLGHGPDPIPLFVLAVALGYIYRQTHRIWPGTIVHMCLNATSVGMLWLAVAAK